jgi:thiosulfate sulfurtransferase
MSYRRIGVGEARDLLSQGNAHVIDVRDPMSFQAGHMPGAKLVNDENVEEFLEKTDKTRPLIVCCYHGNMSQGAADYFSSKGFEATYSLDGGFESWLSQSQI